MKKYPVSVSWVVEKVVFIDANSPEGALDQALNEQPVGGDPVEGSMKHQLLVPQE